MRRVLKVTFGSLALLAALTVIPALMESPQPAAGPYTSALSNVSVGSVVAQSCIDRGCPAAPFCRTFSPGIYCVNVNGHCYNNNCD